LIRNQESGFTDMSGTPYKAVRFITFVPLLEAAPARSLDFATNPPQPEKHMNRIAIVAAIAALSIVGCKKKEEKTETPAATDTATKPVEPAAAPTPAPADPAAAPADPAAAAAAAGEPVSTGIAECDDLVKRYTSCEKLPAEQKNAFMEGAKAWKQGAESGSEEVKKSIADSCKQAAQAADTALKAQGC
jgi:hypothetical protein